MRAQFESGDVYLLENAELASRPSWADSAPASALGSAPRTHFASGRLGDPLMADLSERLARPGTAELILLGSRSSMNENPPAAFCKTPNQSVGYRPDLS